MSHDLLFHALLTAWIRTGDEKLVPSMVACGMWDYQIALRTVVNATKEIYGLNFPGTWFATRVYRAMNSPGCEAEYMREARSILESVLKAFNHEKNL